MKSNTAHKSNNASKNWVRISFGDQGTIESTDIELDPKFTFKAGSLGDGSNNSRTSDLPDINTPADDALGAEGKKVADPTTAFQHQGAKEDEMAMEVPSEEEKEEVGVSALQ